MGAEAGEEVVVDVTVAQRHRVGVGQGDALVLVVEWARRVLGEGVDLPVRDA